MSNPLFSIFAITYNQEDLVLDALNSTLQQEYSPLELVICDDRSQDNTVGVIEKWISENESNFHRVKLIVNSTNLGISKNRKQAIDACSGEFLRGLAGDDILAPASLNHAAQYFEEHPEAIYFHGKAYSFHKLNEMGKPSVIGSTKKTRFFDLSPDKQHVELMFRNRINGTAVFFRRSFFTIVNTEYLNLKYLEDLPDWIEATSLGYPIRYVDSVSVYYRVHEKSVQRSIERTGAASQQTLQYYEDCIEYEKKYTLPFLLSKGYVFRYIYVKKRLARYSWALSNRKTFDQFPLYRKIGQLLTSPYHLYYSLSGRLKNLLFQKNKKRKNCSFERG